MYQRNQLARIVEIDRQVRAGKYPNADSLARDLGVSRRVIYKDRAFMIDRLQAPLATDRRRGGWYYTDPAYTPPNLMVTVVVEEMVTVVEEMKSILRAPGALLTQKEACQLVHAARWHDLGKRAHDFHD